MKKVGGHFIADGDAVNIDVGFVPDKFVAIAKYEETNLVNYEWLRERANTANANGQFGITRAAGGGALTKLSSAAGGFEAYDETANQVLVPAPDGDGVTQGTVADYNTATTYTVRSTTALGSIIRPTVKTGFVYELINASSGAAGTEPTFSTTVGGSTTATSGDIWITREENTVAGGAKGVTVGADIGTDSDEWSWEAELWDAVKPEQDAASFDPVNHKRNE